ncbi:MAG: hypothetical protein ACI861_001800 [Paracoccaceae bacterium]|jgi:hypothetical protein
MSARVHKPNYSAQFGKLKGHFGCRPFGNKQLTNPNWKTSYSSTKRPSFHTPSLTMPLAYCILPAPWRLPWVKKPE